MKVRTPSLRFPINLVDLMSSTLSLPYAISEGDVKGARNIL